MADGNFNSLTVTGTSDLGGDVRVGGHLTVGDAGVGLIRTLSVTGAISSGGDLSISGMSSLTGGVVTDTLTLSRSDVDKSQWPTLSADAAQRVDVEGSLRVSGNADLDGDLNIADNLEVAGDIKASGIIRADTFRPTTDDWEIARNGEDLEIREPEQASKVWARFKDDQSLHLIGTPHLWVDGQIGIGTTTPRKPLTIRAARRGEELIGFEDPSGTLKWHINQNLAGDRPGLNISETGVADGRLFIQVGGNVGIGTTGPRSKLSLGRDLANTKLAVYEGPDTAYGFGVTSGRFHIHIGNPQARFSFLDAAGGNEIVTLRGSGNLGIGTISPAFLLDVNGQARAHRWNTTSDARLKTHVTQLTNVLDKLEKIRGVSFDWNELHEAKDGSQEQREIGVIAQEVEAVFPEIVSMAGAEGYKAVDYGRLTGVLVEAIKELKADNAAFRQRLEVLERA